MISCLNNVVATLFARWETDCRGTSLFAVSRGHSWALALESQTVSLQNSLSQFSLSVIKDDSPAKRDSSHRRIRLADGDKQKIIEAKKKNVS